MQRVTHGLKKSLAVNNYGLISLDEVMAREGHTGLCDPFHVINSKNPNDRYLRRLDVINGWPRHLNSMVHEQIWKKTLGLKDSINSMAYGNYIARFQRIVQHENLRIRTKLTAVAQ